MQSIQIESMENQPEVTTFYSQTACHPIHYAAPTILSNPSAPLVVMPVSSALTVPSPMSIDRCSSINPTSLHNE